jgi:hypothetical protein
MPTFSVTTSLIRSRPTGTASISTGCSTTASARASNPSRHALPFLIAEALQRLGDPRILGISVDGGGSDSEVTIEAEDDGGPATFVIRSGAIDEHEAEEEEEA